MTAFDDTLMRLVSRGWCRNYVETNTLVKVALFKYIPHGNNIVRLAYIHMTLDVKNITKYMDNTARSQLMQKIRNALLFSVLSTIMQRLNVVYRPTDIITAALTINFTCAVLHGIVLPTGEVRRRFHCGYILRSISRQSVLVVSDAIANSVHLRDIGTHHENTLLLVVSTTGFIALLTLVPTWFLQDAQEGSLKDLLIFSFTSRYKQIHIPGLGGFTGIGTILYGLLFVIVTIDDERESTDTINAQSKFFKTLHRSAAMVLSNIFLSQIEPDSTSQVLPVAILLGMYIVSDYLPMSHSVASFVLWRTAAEVSKWIARVLPDAGTDQILLFGLLLCVVPAINTKTAAVIAVAALQVIVRRLMGTLVYIGSTGTVVASVCVLLVTDIVLDAPK
jgi:hypothetical protein